jgi:hypothetical protein
MRSRGGRAGCVGDAVVGTAEGQYLHQLVEDEAISKAGTMAAQRMGIGAPDAMPRTDPSMIEHPLPLRPRGAA